MVLLARLQFSVSNGPVSPQAGGGRRRLLHGERPGAEEPRASGPEHG